MPSDTFAKTARPSNAAIAWVADGELYVEYPMRNGGPNYIVRYHRTVDDLANALNILIENSVPAQKMLMTHPGIKRLEGSTQESRDLASKIVRERFFK
jgi:hypothetical protein